MANRTATYSYPEHWAAAHGLCDGVACIITFDDLTRVILSPAVPLDFFCLVLPATKTTERKLFLLYYKKKTVDECTKKCHMGWRPEDPEQHVYLGNKWVSVTFDIQVVYTTIPVVNFLFCRGEGMFLFSLTIKIHRTTVPQEKHVVAFFLRVGIS